MKPLTQCLGINRKKSSIVSELNPRTQFTATHHVSQLCLHKCKVASTENRKPPSTSDWRIQDRVQDGHTFPLGKEMLSCFHSRARERLTFYKEMELNPDCRKYPSLFPLPRPTLSPTLKGHAPTCQRATCSSNEDCPQLSDYVSVQRQPPCWSCVYLDNPLNLVTHKTLQTQVHLRIGL